MNLRDHDYLCINEKIEYLNIRLCGVTFYGKADASNIGKLALLVFIFVLVIYYTVFTRLFKKNG